VPDTELLHAVGHGPTYEPAMPKTPCPACKCDVPYPAVAELGSTVTCPECDEVFTPPKLKKKAKKYDPKKEETYKVGRANSDQDEKDKTRKAAAAMRGARQRERELKEMAQEQKRFWLDGPEIWLVIFAIGTLGGIPFGLWLARSWDKLGDTKIFLILVVMVAVMMAAVGLGGSAWAWLRKNRWN
jgi:uncharacterized Zn finger protein (UPF0148 family)